MRRRLFVSKALDGVEVGGLLGGPDAEGESDEDRDGHSAHHGPEWDRGGELGQEEHNHVTDDDGENHAQDSAEGSQRHGFEQELADDVAFAGADGFTDADLAGALGDADEHDVHHADAADQQAHGRDGDREQADAGRDPVELFDNFVGRGEGKIVRLVVLHAPLAAQNLLDLIQPVAQHPGPGLDVQVHFLADRRKFAAGLERDEDRVVLFVFAEEGVLALLKHADDFKGAPIQLDLFAGHAGLIREERFDDVDADDHHVAAMQVVNLRDETPLLQRDVGDSGVTRRNALQIALLVGPPAAFDRAVETPEEEDVRHVFDRAGLLADRFGVFGSERLAHVLAAVALADPRAGGEVEGVDVVRAVIFDHRDDDAAQAGKDRGDRDHDRDPDDDAEHGEKASKLVRANHAQRHCDGFGWND